MWTLLALLLWLRLAWCYCQKIRKDVCLQLFPRLPLWWTRSKLSFVECLQQSNWVFGSQLSELSCKSCKSPWRVKHFICWSVKNFYLVSTVECGSNSTFCSRCYWCFRKVLVIKLRVRRSSSGVHGQRPRPPDPIRFSNLICDPVRFSFI